MLNLISNLDEKTKLKELNSFNHVVAWFLHEAFEKMGYPSKLVCESGRIPPADDTLIISNTAMLRMRTDSSDYRDMMRRSTRRILALYLDSDDCISASNARPYDIVLTVVPLRTNNKTFVHVGWGADPRYCYPAQSEKIVFLDRECEVGDLSQQRQLYQVYSRVLPTTGKKILHYNDLFSPKIPWMEVQKVFRKCHYYCCTQYGECDISRLEAATCGALLVIPTYLSRLMPRTMGPLTHAIWETDADLRRIIATETDPQAISKQAGKQTWDLVAERIKAYLEA